MLLLPIDDRGREAILNVKLNVATEVALIDEVDEALRGQPGTGGRKVCVLRAQLRRSARKRSRQFEAGTECKIRLGRTSSVGSAQSVEAQRSGEAELGVDRVSSIDIARKLSVSGAKRLASRGIRDRAIDAPKRIRAVAELVFRREAHVARSANRRLADR